MFFTHEVIMRSKTTHTTDSDRIVVHQGDDVNKIAMRVALGYGATVEQINEIKENVVVELEVKPFFSVQKVNTFISPDDTDVVISQKLEELAKSYNANLISYSVI